MESMMVEWRCVWVVCGSQYVMRTHGISLMPLLCALNLDTVVDVSTSLCNNVCTIHACMCPYVQCKDSKCSIVCLLCVIGALRIHILVYTAFYIMCMCPCT